MRRDNHSWMPPIGMLAGQRLLGEDVKKRTSDPTAVKRRQEIAVNHVNAAAEVDQKRAPRHQRQALRVDQPERGRSRRQDVLRNIGKQAASSPDRRVHGGRSRQGASVVSWSSRVSEIRRRQVWRQCRVQYHPGRAHRPPCRGYRERLVPATVLAPDCGHSPATPGETTERPRRQIRSSSRLDKDRACGRWGCPTAGRGRTGCDRRPPRSRK